MTLAALVEDAERHIYPVDLGYSMEIRPLRESDIPQLIAIYKAAFERHNVFEQDDAFITDYLLDKHRKQQEVGGLLVAVEGDTVLGGLLIRKENYDPSERRLEVKYNHLAVKEKGQGVGSQLMEAAEAHLRAQMSALGVDTVKIEAKIAEGEQESVPFYQKHQFKIVDTLEGHYREHEKVYVMERVLE